VATDVPYRTQAEVDQAAKSLSDEVASSFAEFEGVARGNPKLRAGAAVSIDGLGEPFDGKYTITTSRHRFDPVTGYTTAFSVTGRKDRTLFGLSSTGRVQAVSGPVIGLVSDINDPENQGRVRLTLPWLSDDYVSGWARTVHAGAGKDRGFQVLPEVGDEVLVAFEQGAIDRPVVLGGLYNGLDTPPSGPMNVIDGGTGQVDRRSMVSRKGHRIDLVDASSGDGIRAATAGDKLTLIMDQSQTSITVRSDGTVTIEGSKGITIDAKQSDIALKANKIDMAATAGMNLNGGQGSVDVAATGAVSLKGLSVAIEGQTSTDLKAGAVCTVQGSMVRIN
ncbi:MAG TPA: VgrG-related protein, partial [Microlunatus sp.]|nr:VgrG-related protein [Microlunatus sp.]